MLMTVIQETACLHDEDYIYTKYCEIDAKQLLRMCFVLKALYSETLNMDLFTKLCRIIVLAS